ncbi:DUF7146 domain-containing protein [Aureimonas pseudogalii]|uniref:Toprim domain-containing protein n=1 Tax=Aureimonas pseudogalii TaxID=1744844 RepID=A0A7W6MLT6_9HYPH|nr:toprim domain-containing protein [Aureimonas pseudogalii]MBB4000155.1 hypothetical protein [Aureimonas pseudogalii]
METATDISRQLGDYALSFCKAYLPQGRHAGNYWQIGDVNGAKGASLAICLHTNGAQRAGKWRDYATGERGDLLDLIPHVSHAATFAEVMQEARSFLGKPDIIRAKAQQTAPEPRQADVSRREKAQRLISSAKPFHGSPAQRYLRNRDIERFGPALRFHNKCYAMSVETGQAIELPALLAAITDNAGLTTGVARTWLDVERGAVADMTSPKRVMGDLLGHAVRFGEAGRILACGEGVETMLSIGTALPRLPLAACLTATHLSLFEVPTIVEELWVCRDNDEAGERALHQLFQRLEEAGRSITVREIVPVLGDFNDDLSAWGAEALRTRLVAELGSAAEDYAALA